MIFFTLCSQSFGASDVVRIDMWGNNSVRIRAAPASHTGGINYDAPGALENHPPSIISTEQGKERYCIAPRFYLDSNHDSR